MQRHGLPSAVIITDEFEREMHLTRIALGMPSLQPVVIDHQVSSITADEIAARVGQITRQAQAVWLGAG